MIWRNKWAPLLTVSIILFPFVYLADLAYWLWYGTTDRSTAITLGVTPQVLGMAPS